MPTQTQRLRALRLYKELHRLGRDNPTTPYDFHGKIRRAYERNRYLTDPVKIDSMLELAEHVKKEMSNDHVWPRGVAARMAPIM